MTSIPLKRCLKCGQELPATTDYFYRRAEAKDGLNTRCKACKRAHSNKRYQMNPKIAIARAQQWRDDNPEAHREYTKKWRQENPDKRHAQTSAYKERHPDKATAHYKVQKAVEAGRLPKVSTVLCVDCGKCAQEYHHPDYSKPLEVVALCRYCHNKRHEQRDVQS